MSWGMAMLRVAAGVGHMFQEPRARSGGLDLVTSQKD